MRVRDDLAQVVERVIQVVHPTPLTGVDAQPGAHAVKRFLPEPACHWLAHPHIGRSVHIVCYREVRFGVHFVL